MASKTSVVLIDDIDQSPAIGTVRFGLDGSEYEMELSAEHDAELRKVMARYIEHGRRVPTVKRNPPVSKTRKLSMSDRIAIRAWASETGRVIPKRGRISARTIAEYESERGA